MSSIETTSAAPIERPGLARRMAAFMYEGVLLFGVVFVAGYFFSAMTQQRHAMQGQHALQAFLFAVLGIYFAWFWSRGGQTVAMKAWHIRVVDRQGLALSQARALARYVLSYLWFVPALLSAWAAGLHSTGAIMGALLAGIAAYALLALLLPQKQFLHDVLCGTQLITQLPVKRERKHALKNAR
ncbi:RDD family protein [Paucibacter sp. KCTC 42545]|uniref:RDD family protein n=1 Tax=Paucibacter sp. KCTC 42545 TaxID=1768242 RepID=UPI000733B543|nr:RDD family protein [Paucibacter sp. KCTC 42545]ALT76503.1 hypothetical protein AT984_04105 [Paucibacter sp. KCTC 42545]